MADPGDITCQTLVVEEVPLARFVSYLSATTCCVLQGIQLADHDVKVGLFGGRGSYSMGGRQADSENGDQSCQYKSASEFGSAQGLGHGWAQVIPVAASLP
jgi:hypothetical protein